MEKVLIFCLGVYLGGIVVLGAVRLKSHDGSIWELPGLPLWPVFVCRDLLMMFFWRMVRAWKKS